MKRMYTIKFVQIYTTDESKATVIAKAEAIKHILEKLGIVNSGIEVTSNDVGK
jgi:hypothetical protein